MSWTRRWGRIGAGLLALGTGLPILAMEWAELRQERDALAEEVRGLRAAASTPTFVRGRGEAFLGEARPSGPSLAYAGEPIPDDDAVGLAWARERQTQLTAEAAALRRELARIRPEVDRGEAHGTVDRVEGELPEPIPLRSSSGAVGGAGGIELEETTAAQLARRVERSVADIAEVQAERDEALAMLRREMFNSLLYSAVLGECGHRMTARAVEHCADRVRSRLSSEWARFDACLRETNAVPSYTTAASARGVDGAVLLDRGVVLMCDPRLPEGGRSGG